MCLRVPACVCVCLRLSVRVLPGWLQGGRWGAAERPQRFKLPAACVQITKEARELRTIISRGGRCTVLLPDPRGRGEEGPCCSSGEGVPWRTASGCPSGLAKADPYRKRTGRRGHLEAQGLCVAPPCALGAPCGADAFVLPCMYGPLARAGCRLLGASASGASGLAKRQHR